MSATALLLLLFVSSTIATCPADTIFDVRFNKCYKFVTQPASFLLAEKNCESIGGNLVTVSNAFENTFISGIAAYNESTIQFWIGMNLLYYDQWTWINGDSSLFRNWASGQPTSGPRAGAIQVMDTLWTTVQYNTVLPYMCQIDPNAAPVNACTTPSVPLATPSPLPITVNPTTFINGSCPNGHCSGNNYTLNPDNCKCYTLIVQNMTYSQAIEACDNDNAKLPVILSQADGHFISQTYYDSTYIWLGLNCSSRAVSSCVWQDGSPLQGYSNFNSGYPDGNPFVYMQTYNELWVTVPDTNLNACVCQKDGIP